MAFFADETPVNNSQLGKFPYATVQNIKKFKMPPVIK